MRAKVAERSQVTIPKQLRKKLGIRKGTVLDFHIEHGKLVIEKSIENDSVAQVYGCLGKGIDTDKALKILRGEK